MFWAFLAVAGLSTVLVQMGAMSVWVSVLSMLLKLALVAVLGLVGYVAWKQLRGG